LAEEEISGKNEKQTKIEMSARFSPIRWPLLGEVLVIGKNNPLGKNAAMSIAELCEPDGYKLKIIENNPKIEALLINKSALMFLNEDDITRSILNQIASYAIEEYCLKVDLDISLVSKTEIIPSEM
jgi:hypothetical protein